MPLIIQKAIEYGVPVIDLITGFVKDNAATMSAEQRTELLALLDEHARAFDDEVEGK